MTADDSPTTQPDWDETPVTLNIVQTIIDAHPDFTVTSQYGPDGRQYMMLQFFEEEPNYQASSDFLEMVRELES